MKKIFTALLFATSMALSACAAEIYTGEKSKGNLEKEGYHVVLLSETEAKVLISGINFDDVTVKSVVSAEKGKDDDKDIFLGFYFDSIEEAEKFNSKNNYENYGLMNDYGKATLGANLTARQGTHNNVCYVGSETSFSVAF